MSRRTSLKLTDERERELEKAGEIVVSNPKNDPLMSVVLDAALRHLIESKENIRDRRNKYDPETIQKL